MEYRPLTLCQVLRCTFNLLTLGDPLSVLRVPGSITSCATGVDDTVGMRVGSCIGYAILVYALLFWDKTRLLSIGLGFVLVGMAVLFLVVVIELGLDWERYQPVAVAGTVGAKSST